MARQSKSKGRTLTSKGRQRRSQILSYATVRFASDGYHPTSVADIVGGLGVGKGVFYWYFESKEQLFLEILRDAQKDLRRYQRDSIADLTDPIERIEAGIRAGVIWMADNPELRRLFEFARSEDTFARSMKVGEATLISDAAEHLRIAIDAGRIPCRDPEALAHGIFGVTNQLTMAYIDHGDGDPAEVADLVVSICRNGFAGLSDQLTGDSNSADVIVNPAWSRTV